MRLFLIRSALAAGDLRTGERVLSTKAGASSPLVRVSLDRNRIAFSAGGKVFTAVAATHPDRLTSTEYQLLPAPGDEISFVIDRSAISCPRRFS